MTFTLFKQHLKLFFLPTNSKNKELLEKVPAFFLKKKKKLKKN